MKFDDPLGETKWEAPDDEREQTAVTAGNSTGGMRQMLGKLKDVIDGVKTTTPREAMRAVAGATERAATGAKHYVQSTTVPGMVDDVTKLIRRYPVQTLVIGTTLGWLLSRMRANGDERV